MALPPPEPDIPQPVEDVTSVPNFANNSDTTLLSGVAENRTLTPTRQRKAIAVLLNYTSFFSEGIEGRLRRAFDLECARRNLDLYLIYGRAIEEPDVSCAAYNAVFDLIHPARIDAVILVSNLLAGSCGCARLNEYAKRFSGMPCCSLGMILPDLPSIEVDGRPGMKSLVAHLVRNHGYRRFAFMAGQKHHPHSKERLEACEQFLKEQGLSLDPGLVVYGDFLTHAAEGAMDELLRNRNDFDVVVAASDAMAQGVIASLKKHGRVVPDDCGVTGYDDLIHARFGNPPMTTIAQPLESLAKSALDNVLAQLSGKAVPAVTWVTGELLVRDSCGCLVRSRAEVPNRNLPQVSALDHLRTERDRVQLHIEQKIGDSLESTPATSKLIIQGLTAELSGNGPSLVAISRELFDEARDDPERLRALFGVVEYLEEEFSSFSEKNLEAVWSYIKRELVLALTASHLQQQMAMDFAYVQLLGSEDNVYGALKLGELQETLRKHLPIAGIGTVSLSEYVDGDFDNLKSIVFFVDGVGGPCNASHFPSYWLYPPEATFTSRKTFVVMPLVFESRGLGMSVFEYTHGPIPYHLLRDQISVAVGTYKLQCEIEHQSALRERSVQERLATTQRMESLSLLAGGVAHDLNNVLGPLAALPDLMLAQLANAATDRENLEELRSDIELIKVAGQRASQTIKDLLTLSRQGRIAKTPLDLNRILRECGEDGAARRLQLADSRVCIFVETESTPLVVLGSEAHIVRAIMNLVQNAVDAIDGPGEVKLRSYGIQIDTPLDYYETILPGTYAVIEVTDTGCGLSVEMRQRIFEPFYSTKHLGQRSGTGLGLAIVHGVVKEHDGFINITSAPRHGTTFTLYFPRISSRPKSYRPPETHRAAGERILVIDDEPIQLRTCKRLLTRWGYQVDVTSSGREACERFALIAQEQLERYDLVVLDVQLSAGEDGLEIYERIRKFVPDQKAILASGHAPSDCIEAASEQGIPWLQKPYTADALAEIVRTALDTEPLSDYSKNPS
jgi:signal transduction histidine kinase/DNA-binding LacI/PurR family transcriptional regulator/ActR/RegA family two-component response regulator